MKIALTSVLVDDQAKALKFYTEVLRFVKKKDFPIGEYRWLTVISPEGHEDVELVLEPTAHPAARVYQKALFKDGIPATAFECADVTAEYQRLKSLNVVFKSAPTRMGPVSMVVFEDTCGNLIQIYQHHIST
jgi:catechol 2,3-dioxygenase-like lactoylglutathione lyase family enzyme